MKLFDSINYILIRAGMTSHQFTQKHLYNIRNSIMLLIFAINFVFIMVNLIHGPENLKDYTDSIFLMNTVVSTGINYAFVIWKMAEIFRFMDDLEDTVSTSKCRDTFE